MFHWDHAGLDSCRVCRLLGKLGLQTDRSVPSGRAWRMGHTWLGARCLFEVPAPLPFLEPEAGWAVAAQGSGARQKPRTR